SQRFIDLVAQLREKCLNAFDNQEYPFEELVDQLSVEGDPSRNPIFDVMFAFQNNENEKITFGEADVVLLPTPNNVSKFDLTMNIEGIEDGYELNWEYCTDLFKEKTIARMNEQFVQLLK
ncbi:condensation domain-containing protein, partial [Bacillus wiedmannii]